MATSNQRTCNRCTAPCNNDVCIACKRELNELDRGGYESNAEPHECTQCGTEYETDGSDPCPECGSTRRRYAGEL